MSTSAMLALLFVAALLLSVGSAWVSGQPAAGSCRFSSPAVAIGCLEEKCLVCTADSLCRWVTWRQCRED